MFRHVAWFNEAPIQPGPEGGLTSDSATVCARCLAPARTLEELGLECSVFGNLDAADPTEVSRHLQKLHVEIVVIGSFMGSSLLPMARAAKHLGCYVIADINDEEIASPDLVKLVEIVDQIVASCPDVAAAIHHATGHAAIIIPDCDEEDDGAQSPMAIAKLWLESFKKLKAKPPACANTNEPTKH